MNGPSKITFFLPNLFTALNLACGFASIILSSKGESYFASMIIILGAIFDLVDGRVARLTGTQSSFGEQFDSMSDVVSFGVAPAFLIYTQVLSQFDRLGAVVAFLFLLCGALRLARFNANIEKTGSNYFQGVPIPCAALAIVGYIQFSLKIPEVNKLSFFALIYVVLYSLLMISNIPFFSFKNFAWAKDYRKRNFFIMILLLALTFSYYQLMIAVIINGYIIWSLISFFIKKGIKGEIFNWRN